MDRAFLSGASASAPTPPASPSIGYATEGNPGTGTPPTKPGPWWYHMMTEELRAVLVAAGLTPSQTDLTQLLQALPGALASRPEMARSLTINGYQKLPGGLILQWGTGTTSGGTSTVIMPLAFLNNCLETFVSVNGTGNSVVTINKALASLTVTSYVASTGAFNNQTFNWLAFGN